MTMEDNERRAAIMRGGMSSSSQQAQKKTSSSTTVASSTNETEKKPSTNTSSAASKGTVGSTTKDDDDTITKNILNELNESLAEAFPKVEEEKSTTTTTKTTDKTEEVTTPTTAATTPQLQNYSLDEEFQRAQEMALAVAALGSSSSGGMGLGSWVPLKKPMNIKKAVDKVINKRNDHNINNNNKLKKILPTRSQSFDEEKSPTAAQRARGMVRKRTFDNQPRSVGSSPTPPPTIPTLTEEAVQTTGKEHNQQSAVPDAEAETAPAPEAPLIVSSGDDESNPPKTSSTTDPQLVEEDTELTLNNLLPDEVLRLLPDEIVRYLNQFVHQLKTHVPPRLYPLIGMSNFCILYLSCVPASFLHFCTALLLLNTTTYITLAQEDSSLSLWEPTTVVAPSATAITQSEEQRHQAEPTVTTCKQLEEEEEEEEEVEQIQVPPSPVVSKVRLEWLEDEFFPQEDLQHLQELQTNSTLAERRRFLKARKGSVEAASAQLGSYLQWRDENRITAFFSQPKTFSTDEDDWKSAARGALEVARSNDPTTTNVNNLHTMLPRLVSVLPDDSLSKLGARLVHVLPCQLDSKLASHQTYALAVGMYLDRQLDRNTTEKVTVVIDIRAGKGWSNPSSVSIVPFLKVVVGLLNSYFPERLSKCILFPLPRTATMLFNTAKSYLDPDTANKIEVCSGSGSITSPVPAQVKTFIDEPSIQMMEERRKSFFKG